MELLQCNDSSHISISISWTPQPASEVTVDKLSWLWPVKKCTATWTHELCDNQLIQHCWVLLLLVSLSLPARVEWGEAESVIIYPVTGHLDNHEAAAAGAQYSVPSLAGDKVTWAGRTTAGARAWDEWRQSCGGYKVQQCPQSASEELTASISS